MDAKAEHILEILDRCCNNFRFPMLDNGYVYLAATRLSLFRSPEDWALVIEVFGFSPRSGLPDIHIYSFASRLHNRDKPETYVNQKAYENYLAHSPNNESRFVNPIEEGAWQDEESGELVSDDANQVVLRGQSFRLPARGAYRRHGIELLDPDRVHVFELCRYLAAEARERVLATQSELRISVRPEMSQILQLDEWNHPNVVDESERPSGSVTFQQLARVLETGDVSLYRPTQAANTHWENWPDGGLL
jgi:hypothetical protein